jgi:hypothetical protein
MFGAVKVPRSRKPTIALLLASLASASSPAAASAPPIEGHWQGRTAQGLPVVFGVRAGSVVNVRWFADVGLCGRQEVRYPRAVIPLEESGTLRRNLRRRHPDRGVLLLARTRARQGHLPEDDRPPRLPTEGDPLPRRPATLRRSTREPLP